MDNDASYRADGISTFDRGFFANVFRGAQRKRATHRSCGAQGGAQHLFIRIVSAQFSGINALQRHRLIYNAVLDLMPDPIHAVRIDAQVA